MAQWLKQSTAFTFRIGPFVDSTDGVTAETALSIAQADIQISKDGAAFAQTSAATPTTTHDTDGWYQCPLTATDTNTLGPLTVQVTMAGALPVWKDFMVVSANVYDSLVDATDNLEVDTTQWLGTACATPTTAGVPETDPTHLGGSTQSLADLKDFADAGYDPATNKVEGVKTVDTTTTNTDMRGTDNAALASVLGALTDLAAAGDPTATDTVMQYVKQLINVLVGTTGVTTWPASAAPANGVSIAEALRAAYDDTNDLQTNQGNWLTATGFSTHAAADVWTAVTRTLTANTNFNDPTAATIAAAVWDALQASHVTAGSFGEIATEIAAILVDTDTSIPALIAALNDLSAADVNAEVDTALGTTTQTLPGQGAPTATPTIVAALMYLYKQWRNKTESTATTMSLYDDAGTTVDQKATLSDDGTTATKAEVGTGP